MMTNSMYEKLAQSLHNQKDTFLITITHYSESHVIGYKALLWTDGDFYTEDPLPTSFRRRLIENSQKLIRKKRSRKMKFSWNGSLVECFAEYFPPPHHLIIAGAGHICEPVTQLGNMLGFYVTIIDDRAEFATKERFPKANQVVCKSFLNFFREVEISDNTYILLLTRGHMFDVLSLKELLSREEKAAYIGMIGSRRRISGVFEELKLEFPHESFEHIYTPVGLDIGAETPSEIAISIMAEILKVKNKRSGLSLSSKIRKYAKMGFHEGATKWNSYT